MVGVLDGARSGSWPPEIDILENLAQSDSVSLYVRYNSANRFDSSTVTFPQHSDLPHLRSGLRNLGHFVVHGRLPVGPFQSVEYAQPEYLIADGP